MGLIIPTSVLHKYEHIVYVIRAGVDLPSIQDENTYTLLPQLISDYLVERTTSI